MKAILVLDEMPERCIDCPCMYVVQKSQISEYCKAIVGEGFRGYLRIEDVSERPKWCPLKPMPEKLDAIEISIQLGEHEVDSRLIYQVDGYNKCIDEILRGTKND